jgi:hypothetical protein
MADRAEPPPVAPLHPWNTWTRRGVIADFFGIFSFDEIVFGLQ